MVRLISMVLLFCVLWSLIGTRVRATDEVSAPYKVQWPLGWDITSLPAATTNSGKNIGGTRIRAMKKDGAEPVVGIEFTYIPRSDQGRAILEEEFSSALKTIGNAYRAKGFNVIEDTPAQVTLGKLAALETNVQVKGPNFTLDQYLAIALGKNHVYSISFSGQEAQFKKYHQGLGQPGQASHP